MIGYCNTYKVFKRLNIKSTNMLETLPPKTELITAINTTWKSLTNRDITPEEFDHLYDEDSDDLKLMLHYLNTRLEVKRHAEELATFLKALRDPC